MWNQLFFLAKTENSGEFGILCRFSPSGEMTACLPDDGVVLSPELEKFISDRCKNNFYEVKESLDEDSQLDKVEVRITLYGESGTVQMETTPYITLHQRSLTQEFTPVQIDGWPCCDTEGVEHLVNVYAEEDPRGDIFYTIVPDIKMEDHEEQALLEKITELANAMHKE